MSVLSFFDKENVSLLINVGGGSINAALVLFQKKQIPKFLYCVSAPFVEEKQDNPRFSKEASVLLDSVLRDTIKNGWSKIPNTNKKISHAIISFSSPWFIFKTKDIHLSQEIPFVITKSFLDSILTKEEKLFEKEYTNENSEPLKNKIEVIEKSIVHTKVNGYTVEDIISKKTKKFDAFMCLSAVSLSVKEKVADIVLKHTHIPKENILLHSFPLVLFSTVRDNLAPDTDFIVFNINREITDVVFVSANVVKSITSFPFGKNTIIRLIAKTFNISPEIAESQLVMYLSQKVNEQISGTMQNLIQDLEKEWAVYFEDALLTISPDMVWPKQTYIVAEDKTLPIFIEFLKIHKTDATTSFRKNAEIVRLDDQLLSSLYSNVMKIQIDESLVVLAVFYNKLFQRE